MTREPGNLLPVMVMYERVGRGAPGRCESRCGLPCRAKGRLSRPTYVTALLFAVGHTSVDLKNLRQFCVVARPRAFLHLFSSRQHWLSGAALPLGSLVAICRRPASAQNQQPLNPVAVAPATPRSNATRAGNDRKPCRSGPSARREPRRNRCRRRSRPSARKPYRRRRAAARWSFPTPLNGNLVATSASRLGLTVHETPASVEIVTQQQMREQGYRTTTETAQGAVGVLAADLGGAPAVFSMRGFTGPLREHALQRDMDRPGRHHVAHHGDGQSRSGRIPEGPSSRHERPRLRSAAPSISSAGSRHRRDQERARYVDRYARHLSHAFRFGREHQHCRARLSFRCLLIEGRRLHRRRRRPAQQHLGATQLPRQRRLQSVRRGRLQARRRPRLLGHAADDDGVFRAVLHPWRRGGIGD